MLRYVFLIFIFASCSFDQEKADIVVPEFPDPEHASMAGKARVFISLDSARGFFDSLEYDTKGRLIRSINNRISRQSLIIYSYDSNNYPIRFYHRSNHITNYKFIYDLNDDTLFQTRYSSREEDFHSADSSFTDHVEVAYYLIENGRIVEFVENQDSRVYYKYDHLGRIISILKINGNFNYQFNYINNSYRLKSQILMQNSDTIFVKEYTDGLLSSRKENFELKPITNYLIKSIN